MPLTQPHGVTTQIQQERASYYDILERTQREGMDITDWLTWFLATLERAIAGAGQTLESVLTKARFWERFAGGGMNERQVKLLNRLLDGCEGKLTTSKWAKIAKCSQDTAYRDILGLLELGALMKAEAGGRSTSYDLAQ
jgi:Fic family protein